MSGLVRFVGAGPGAADLLTFRAAAAIEQADIVIWAGSLVSEDVLVHAREGAETYDSATMTLEDVTAIYERVAAEDLVVARLQSGDPSLYGAIQEQIEVCESLEIAWEIIPGVSSFGAAAAAIGHELTVPGVSQSIVLTRIGHRASPMPDGESLQEWAAHGSSIALFLAAARPDDVQADLLAGGYAPDTPVAIVHRATWPDELIIKCTLEELAASIKEAKLVKSTLLLIGPAIEASGARSHLYHPGHTHMFRRRDRAVAFP